MKSCLDCFHCKKTAIASIFILKCKIPFKTPNPNNGKIEYFSNWLTDSGLEKIIKLSKNDGRKVKFRNVFILAKSCTYFDPDPKIQEIT